MGRFNGREFRVRFNGVAVTDWMSFIEWFGNEPHNHDGAIDQALTYAQEKLEVEVRGGNND